MRRAFGRLGGSCTGGVSFAAVIRAERSRRRFTSPAMRR